MLNAEAEDEVPVDVHSLTTSVDSDRAFEGRAHSCLLLITYLIIEYVAYSLEMAAHFISDLSFR